jgi:hypothetical protein
MIPVATLELIQTTAQEAQSAKILPELNTDGRTAYVQIANEIREIELAPAPRQHTIECLGDLIKYALAIKDLSPVVWHGDDGVVLIVKDSDRRDRVSFPLSKSARFVTLQTLAIEKNYLTQAQFIRLLRVDLGLDNVTVVSKFRKLQWSSGSDTDRDAQHGNERIGKTVIAKVQAVEDLPDEINIDVPVYQQPGERQEYTVKCTIEIDTINQGFQLVPKPDELQRVITLAQDQIRMRLDDNLKGAEIPIYQGRP